MGKKEAILVILFLFLLVNSVIAEDEEVFTTHKAKPFITMEFDEPINIVDVTMENMDVPDVEYGYSDFTIVYGNERLNATLTPNVPLDNGIYDFVVLVEDLVHNVGTYGKKILVDVPITDIMMLQPRLYRMNASVGDIIIKTRDPDSLIDKKAYCKYAHLLGYSLQKKFEVATEFDVSNASTHILHDYDFSLSYNKNFYVICQDFDGRMNYQFFKLDYDVTPPIITSTSFNPPKMITLENVFNFTVETNEDTFCFFDLLGSRYYFNNFTKNDIYSVDAYTQSHVATMNKILPEENGIYGLNLVCQDRAFWTSEKVVDYEVDLSAALQILVETPGEFTSDDLFTLDFFTNKPSYCEYSFDDSDLFNTDSTPAVPLSHHKSLNEIYADEGPHIIHFECVSDSAEITQFRELDYSFIVDKTSPEQPVLGGPNVSCTRNSLKVEAESSDNESGIDYYMYMVEKSGKQVVNWTIGGSEIEISDTALNTTDGDIFFVSVVAFNRAGLKSMYSSKSIRFDESGISCDETPPVVTYNISQTFGMNLLVLNCSDNAGRCVDLRYGLVEFGKCSPTDFYTSPINLDKNYFLCYYAADAAGNTVNGTENVSIFANSADMAHCNNGIFESDLDETDLDCGGPCFGCGVGKSCVDDSDCVDKFCLNNVCTTPTCTDGYFQKSIETDLDCGKKCSLENFRCDVGQNCEVHSDCISGFCDNYTCEPSSCDDSVKNGNESDVDCGGLDCLGCGIGSVCLSDSDCSSNYCKSGFCEDYKKKDCDGDGLYDWWEQKYFKCSADLTGCFDCASPNEDPDGDLLLNIDEIKKGTDPTRKDTDGDSYSDKVELDLGYDPLNVKDHPINWLLVFLMFIILIIASYLASSYTFDYFKPMRDIEFKKYQLKLEEEKKKKEQEKSLEKKPVSKISIPIKQHAEKQEIKSNPVKNIVPPSDKKISSHKKIKRKVDLTREKERGKIFDAFEGKLSKSSLANDEFKKLLAKKLRARKKLKSGLKDNKVSSGDFVPTKKQDLSELEKFEKEANSSSSTDDLVKKVENTDVLDQLLFKASKKDSSGSSFDSLENIGHKTDSLSKLASRKVSADALDRLLNKKKASLDGLSSRGEKSSLSELDGLLNKKKDDSLMNSVAQGLSNGMNLSFIVGLLKKLLDDGKINKADLEQLLMDLYSSGKLSNVDYMRIKDDLGL